MRQPLISANSQTVATEQASNGETSSLAVPGAPGAPNPRANAPRGLRSDPRANQKARTRQAIVSAALALYEQGITPTVAQAAAHAGVSRATAYRYFPTAEALLVELAVTPAVAQVDDMLAELTSDDVAERLSVLLDVFGRIAIAEEVTLRTALRVYQDTWLRNHRRQAPGASEPDASPRMPADDQPPIREGRRMRWLDKVLEPLGPALAELPESQRRRLRAGLALTLGMDSIAIMKDVCGLDDDEALAVLRWAAGVLLRAGLDASDPLDHTS